MQNFQSQQIPHATEATRMHNFQTQQNYMLKKKKAAQPMRIQDFQTQQKPHVTEVSQNADDALLVRFVILKSWGNFSFQNKTLKSF